MPYGSQLIKAVAQWTAHRVMFYCMSDFLPPKHILFY